MSSGSQCLREREREVLNLTVGSASGVTFSAGNDSAKVELEPVAEESKLR